MNLSFRQVSWRTGKTALSFIRRRVFIEEQNVSVEEEWDEYDEKAHHFLVFLDETPVACARVLDEGDCFHIGRVAVLANYRNQKIGRRLMEFILSWCQQNISDHKIYLHAQTTRIRFYEHLGFVTFGDVFMDAGIEHIEMWYEPD